MLPGMEGSLGLSNGPSTLAHTMMQRSVSSLRPRVQPDDLRSACSTVLYTSVLLMLIANFWMDFLEYLGKHPSCNPLL